MSLAGSIAGLASQPAALTDGKGAIGHKPRIQQAPPSDPATRIGGQILKQCKRISAGRADSIGNSSPPGSLSAPFGPTVSVPGVIVSAVACTAPRRGTTAPGIQRRWTRGSVAIPHAAPLNTYLWYLIYHLYESVPCSILTDPRPTPEPFVRRATPYYKPEGPTARSVSAFFNRQA